MVADHSFSFFKLASFTLAHAHVRRIQHKSITKIGEYSWKTFFFHWQQSGLNVLSTFNSALILTWDTSLTTFWPVAIAQFPHS